MSLTVKIWQVQNFSGFIGMYLKLWQYLYKYEVFFCAWLKLMGSGSYFSDLRVIPHPLFDSASAKPPLGVSWVSSINMTRKIPSSDEDPPHCLQIAKMRSRRGIDWECDPSWITSLDRGTRVLSWERLTSASWRNTSEELPLRIGITWSSIS